MSEMTSEADPLHLALLGFTGCIGEALTDICSYGFTIGETYVPFDPDPEDDIDPDCEPGEDGFICSQAWVRVMGVDPTAAPESFGSGDCSVDLRLTLEVGVLRCVTVPDEGEAPTATDVMMAGLQAMTDMKVIYCAAMACEVWDAIDSVSWTPNGPLGGQYGGVWVFTVEL